VMGAPVFPLFRLLSSAKLIVNINDIETNQMASTWLQKIFMYLSEFIAKRFSHLYVVNNKYLVSQNMHCTSDKVRFVPFGGDHVLNSSITGADERLILHEFKLLAGHYSMSISEIVPENNCELILESFRRTGMKFVYVGNWSQSVYSRELRYKYCSYKNIVLLDRISDQKVLYTLRSNCLFYVSGNSADCATVSLIEAMFFGKPILAFNCHFNKATTNHLAHYFNSVFDLTEMLLQPIELYHHDASKLFDFAFNNYSWTKVVADYEALYV
jgi:glycosyltransferase involved in cell wall biosynthesis